MSGKVFCHEKNLSPLTPPPPKKVGWFKRLWRKYFK